MGSPINTPEGKLLHDMLINGSMPYWSTLKGTGIDIAHLERKFEMLRPQLPYLGMYRPLREHYGAIARRHMLPYFDEHQELGNRECIRLWASRRHTSMGLIVEYYSSENRKHGRADVFLTKKGLWTIDINDTLMTAGSVAELCQILEDGVGEAFVGGTRESISLVGRLSHALDDLLLRRIEDRRKHLDSMERLHEEMTALNERIFGRS